MWNTAWSYLYYRFVVYLLCRSEEMKYFTLYHIAGGHTAFTLTHFGDIVAEINAALCIVTRARMLCTTFPQVWIEPTTYHVYSLPCCVRDTAWSCFFFLILQTFSLLFRYIEIYYEVTSNIFDNYNNFWFNYKSTFTYKVHDLYVCTNIINSTVYLVERANLRNYRIYHILHSLFFCLFDFVGNNVNSLYLKTFRYA